MLSRIPLALMLACDFDHESQARKRGTRQWTADM